MSEVDGNTDSTLSHSVLTAGELLSRLAQLINQSSAIGDLTPEAVRETLGVTLRANVDGDFGAVAQLTADWNYILDLRPGTTSGPPVFLEFWPTDPATRPTLTSICDVDLDQFATLLEEAGFQRTPWFGEHGRRMGHLFNRGAVRVTVDTEGEADDATGHECIRGVRVQ